MHSRKYYQSLQLLTLPFGEKGCNKPPAAPEPPDPYASIATTAEVFAWVLGLWMYVQHWCLTSPALSYRCTTVG